MVLPWVLSVLFRLVLMCMTLKPVNANVKAKAAAVAEHDPVRDALLIAVKAMLP